MLSLAHLQRWLFVWNAHCDGAAVRVFVPYLHVPQVKNSSQNLEHAHLSALINTCKWRPNIPPALEAVKVWHEHTEPLPVWVTACTFREEELPRRAKAWRVVLSSLLSSTPSIAGLRPCLV